jgi:hypothetical protein
MVNDIHSPRPLSATATSFRDPSRDKFTPLPARPQSGGLRSMLARRLQASLTGGGGGGVESSSANSSPERGRGRGAVESESEGLGEDEEDEEDEGFEAHEVSSCMIMYICICMDIFI